MNKLKTMFFVLSLAASTLVSFFASEAFAIACSKVPAVCVAFCNRVNNTTAAVGCWCSGVPSPCTYDAVECAHSASVDSVAFSDLATCMWNNRRTKGPIAPGAPVGELSADPYDYSSWDSFLDDVSPDGD